MSPNIGRNDPCWCGSGKKYKRCCLAKDEEAARVAARNAELVDEILGQDDIFDEDVDSDEEWPEDEYVALDVATITRLCYTRGVVASLGDLRSGRGLRVTEWKAPHIPQGLLDAIDADALDELAGRWGDPLAGRWSPEAVDGTEVVIVDIQTDMDLFTIEGFNLRLMVGDVDAEEERRIMQFCRLLEDESSVIEQAPLVVESIPIELAEARIPDPPR